ncbi:MAG: hypothetical protein ACTHU0_25120 [Kofleriaceae bacterium]
MREGTLERAPIELPPGGEPIGLVVDRAERVLIAFRDGRIAVRDRGAWTTTRPTSQLPPDRSGPPPATSR